MYILISQKSKEMLVSDNFKQIYRFVVKHQDSKVKTIKYPGVARVMRKSKFLTEFYLATKDAWLLFDLVEIMMKGRPNQKAYISSLNLDEKYNRYEEEQKEL